MSDQKIYTTKIGDRVVWKSRGDFTLMVTEHNGFKLGDRVVLQGYAGIVIRFDPEDALDVAVAFDHVDVFDCIQWVRSRDLVKL